MTARFIPAALDLDARDQLVAEQDAHLHAIPGFDSQAIHDAEDDDYARELDALYEREHACTFCVNGHCPHCMF